MSRSKPASTHGGGAFGIDIFRFIAASTQGGAEFTFELFFTTDSTLGGVIK